MKKSLLYLLMKMAHHPTFHLQFRSCHDKTDVDGFRNLKLSLTMSQTIDFLSVYELRQNRRCLRVNVSSVSLKLVQH